MVSVNPDYGINDPYSIPNRFLSNVTHDTHPQLLSWTEDYARDNTSIQSADSREVITSPASSKKGRNAGKGEGKGAGFNTSPRLVESFGTRNIRHVHVPISAKRLQNLFRYMVNIHWTVQLAGIATSSLTSWVLFAAIWYVIEKIDPQGNCIENVDSFYSALMFSIVTQNTIGYGNTYITNECKSSVFVLWVQCVVGLILDSLMVAVILSKITHPKFRQSTIYFSDCVCIHKADTEYMLSFRIADMSDGSMPEAHVRLYLIHSVLDESSGVRALTLEELDVGYDHGRDRLILLLPWVVEHPINQDSPMFNMSYDDINTGHFELIVILEGAVEETGSTAQCIKSYIAEDVRWGSQFGSMLARDTTRGRRQYVTDFHRMNHVIPQPDMPLASLAEVLRNKYIGCNPELKYSVNSSGSVHASMKRSPRARSTLMDIDV